MWSLSSPSLPLGDPASTTFSRLKSDGGIKELGLSILSAESARLFLSAFHEEEPLKDRPEQGAFIPPETELLENLLKVQERVVARSHDRPTIATIDQDASVIENAKDEARPTYLGPTGYEPVITYWAEKDMILADQFRGGNVPASYDLLSSLIQSIAMLPDTVTEVRYRADFASYTHDLMDTLRTGVTINDRRIKVIFAISANMTASLWGEIKKLPNDPWKPLRKVTDKGLIAGRKEWAEVVFVPSKGSTKKDSVPDRYFAIRVRPSQGQLFADGNSYHYYPVATNNWTWDGERLLRWHREKCGTVEKVFDALKDDQAGGVMPCGRFYANAAWWRLNCIACNVISVMKRKALPQNWCTYRMKALRFFLIGVAGRIIRTGRQIILRFSGMPSVREIFQDARRGGSLYSQIPRRKVLVSSRLFVSTPIREGPFFGLFYRRGDGARSKTGPAREVPM